jgi:DNA mismatch repair protein MutS2
VASARARTNDLVAFRIESLPGVGPALAGKIRAAFGSDEAFREACDTLDLDPLFDVEGLSERRAFDLVASVRRSETMELAGTERARDVRREIEDQLASYAHTAYARRYLRLLPVLRDAKKISVHAEHVMHVRDQIEGLDREAIGRALDALTPLREPQRVPGLHRIVVVDTQEQEFELRSRGLDRWCRIVSGREGRGELQQAEFVLYAGEDRASVSEAEAVVDIDAGANVWDFVPESEAEFVRQNQKTITALAELARLTGRASAAEKCLVAAQTTPPPSAANINAAAQAALKVANEQFQLGMQTLSLSGAQILELLASTLPPALAEVRTRAVLAGRATFKELTGRDWDIFQKGLPIRLDDEEIELLDTRAKATSAVDEFRRSQKSAKDIHAARANLETEFRQWLRYDVDFAMGSWALDVGARPARSSDQLRFEAASHLRLIKTGKTQAISYRIGGAEPIAVLTGANSGGKSTLLELISQLLLLHHMGLPVPAQDAEIPLIDELMFFTASRGVNAGAFETFLNELFPPLTRPGRRFLLLDEVESMTELEAAGRILGVFLGEVRRTGGLCVMVTHLPTEVLQHAKVPVRIDGIDAVGLDENFNLIVDRQPKLGHRARSTPELILRRVHARSDGAVKQLFGRILSHWT